MVPYPFHLEPKAQEAKCTILVSRRNCVASFEQWNAFKTRNNLIWIYKSNLLRQKLKTREVNKLQ